MNVVKDGDVGWRGGGVGELDDAGEAPRGARQTWGEAALEGVGFRLGKSGEEERGEHASRWKEPVSFGAEERNSFAIP